MSIGKSKILMLALLLCLMIPSALAADVSVVNSEDWSDVFSVLLAKSLEGERAFFLNSDTIVSLTKVLSQTDTLYVYESDEPFIRGLDRQLSSVGYDASLEASSDSFNLDLDPQNGRYYVIARDNPRISLSLASLAVKDNAWVFIVDEDNVAEVSARLEDADSVIAVGPFRRDLLEEIEPYFTRYINNDDIFQDSQDLAEIYGFENSVVLADGSLLEIEFFASKTPVLLSGYNLILDKTYDFLVENDVKSVVVVGNELAVIGEQIRSKSDKRISVFVKFGQSDTSASGKVYALTMFPLPTPRLALTVERAVYDAKEEQLVASYTNLGNAGIYQLTSLVIKDGEGNELGTASNPEVVYIGAGENIAIPFDIELPVESLDEDTIVEFYTSFGLYPSGLDIFLTMKDSFGPPFQLPLSLAEIGDDPSDIVVDDVAYYPGLKRVGVTVTNNGDNEVFYNVKVNGLIVNGLEENLFKKDSIAPLKTKTTYIPVELDKVDIQENTEFDLTVTYGNNEDFLFKNLNLKYPFKTAGGMLTGLVAGFTGDGSPVPLIIIAVVIIGLVAVFVFVKKGKKDNKRSKR